MDKYFLVLCCWVGTFYLYFQIKMNGRKKLEFLKYINEEFANTKLGQFVEFVLFTIVGTFFQYIIVEPATPRHALAAGLAWSGTLGTASILDKIKPDVQEPEH